MLEFFSANVLGQENNVLYPNRVPVTDVESLRRAVSTDYVCAEYKNNYRANHNFLRSNCLAFDVDNDGCEDKEHWISPEDVIKNFPDVTMAFHFSRHNGIDKHYIDDSTGEVLRVVTARPRFHVFFEIEPVTDFQLYARMKKDALSLMPYFDTGALDSARFFFGTQEPQVLYHGGTATLNDYLYPSDFDEELAKIKVGSRNKTLSLFAGRILKRYGDSEKAQELFLEKSRLCDPPLDDDEVRGIWASAQGFYKRISAQPDYIPPEQYELGTSGNNNPTWDEPLPLGGENLPTFPVDALPKALRGYAEAVGQSTQTPVDMAAVACLTVASACMRNLYKVEGKPDWHEPTNLYSVIIAEPSERKSAVISLATKPVDEYIAEYNSLHKVEFEMSRASKQRLENKKNSLISQGRKKGEDTVAEDFNDALRSVVEQIVSFEEVKPMKIYVDDTTPEKLTETLADNNNAISVISSEGGIFDVLSGTYSNKVNIDVFLKAYSGENISVERIMRQSVFVQEACLTILLSVQPVVIGELMSNKKFRHRGLTARFLYTTPQSVVGSRTLDSASIPKEKYLAYREMIRNLLAERRQGSAQLIPLTEEAKSCLSFYYDLVEKMLGGELTMYSDWLGKLVGNTLRIAGILARCSVLKRDVDEAVLESDPPIVIDGAVMRNAIKIGNYFLAHAINAYGDMGVRSDFKAASMVIDKIREHHMTEITRRDIMRMCRWIGSAQEAQSILGHLEDYGYIRLSSLDISDKLRSGRPKNAVYAVNPRIR